MITRKNKYTLSFLFLALICICSSGCIFIPIIDGVKKVGITKSDREALLSQRVKEFQDLIYWNSFQPASAMIREDIRREQIKSLSKRFKGYRLVESKIDFMDFDESSHTAVVTVTAKRFKVPFYIVEDYIEDQTWEFSITDGWVFVSAKESTTSEKE